MPAPTSTPRPLLLARRPSPLLARGQLTHLTASSSPPTPARSLAQWQAYTAAYAAAGWDVREVDPADECPDGVFLEDALVVFPALRRRGAAPTEGHAETGLAVLVRSGTPARRGEYASTLRAVQAHLLPRGYALLDFNTGASDGDATLDGGDVLKVLPSASAPHRAPTVYVGQSTRTNAAGLALLQGALEPRGWTVCAVSVEHHLHLKSAITALPRSGEVIGHYVRRGRKAEGDGDGEPTATPGVTLPGGERVRPIGEEEGIAVVDLSTSTHDTASDAATPTPTPTPTPLLISARATKTMEMLRAEGYDVRAVEVDEFEKMEGCVTCLSVRVRGPHYY